MFRSEMGEQVHRNAFVKFGLAVATHCMKAADSMLPGSLCCMIHFSNELDLRFGMLWKRKPSGADKSFWNMLSGQRKLLLFLYLCCSQDELLGVSPHMSPGRPASWDWRNPGLCLYKQRCLPEDQAFVIHFQRT